MGFTLIELLVIISVIALLSSIVFSSMIQARRRARDTKRIADIKQLQTALDLYLSDKGTYPTVFEYGEGESAAPYNCGGWDSSEIDFNNDGKPFIAPLIDSGIIQQSPHDPGGSKTACSSPYGYRYFFYPKGVCSDVCDGGAFYVLGINSFESLATFASPGWKCHGSGWTSGPASDPSLRDWGTEFAWVTGRCQ